MLDCPSYLLASTLWHLDYKSANNRAYLCECRRDTGKAALAAETFCLGLSDDGASMGGLNAAESRKIAAAAATTAAATTTTATMANNIVARSGVHVPVGDVASVGGLVPKTVAVDVFAGSLAGQCNFMAVVVDRDNRIAGSGTGAAVHTIAFDGIGVGAITTAATGGDIIARSCLDIPVGNVAAIRGSVPEIIAVDAGARGLAGERHLLSLIVLLDDWEVRAGPGSAVDTVGLDGVSAHNRYRGRKSQSDE